MEIICLAQTNLNRYRVRSASLASLGIHDIISTQLLEKERRDDLRSISSVPGANRLLAMVALVALVCMTRKEMSLSTLQYNNADYGCLAIKNSLVSYIGA